MHRLSDIDTESRTASCAGCGSVGISIKDGRWKCGVARERERASPNRNKRGPRPGRKKQDQPGSHGIRPSVVRRSRVDQPCALCGSVKAIKLDHCHDSGALRGWLCHSCNVGLGFLRDDPALLAKAIAYLSDPPGVVLK